MKIGIMGAGGIAHIMAKTLSGMGNEAEKYAIASRNYDKARQFADKWGFFKAYGSYQELVNDPDVELVYIATPHSHHYECMKLCIEHGKHVLCEKAFTRNASEAKDILSLAEQKKVFVTEAIWTRYMPSRKIINDMISSDIIGKPHMLTANLHYHICMNERIVKPELAGGALLDVGVYTLNFTLMHFGEEIDHIDSSCQLTNTGVDGVNTMTVYYKDGRVASLTSGIYSRSDRKGIIYGEKGYIIVENINNPQSISAYDDSDNLIKRIDVPTQITGYEYEVLESIKCIRENKLESIAMPHAKTIAVMEMMDHIRMDMGIQYPGE